MLAPFLKLILKSTSFSISYHLDQPLPSSRPRYNVENRVYLLIFTPRPPVKFLWSKMAVLATSEELVFFETIFTSSLATGEELVFLKPSLLPL